MSLSQERARQAGEQERRAAAAAERHVEEVAGLRRQLEAELAAKAAAEAQLEGRLGDSQSRASQLQVMCCSRVQQLLAVALTISQQW